MTKGFRFVDSRLNLSDNFMKNSLINTIEKEQLKSGIPSFREGDQLNVHVKIKEGDKQRIQQFKGTVIATDGGGIDATFTMRRVTHGEGVERVFPLHSPNIDKIEVLRQGRVRRAKLYYLRDRAGKKARLTEDTRKAAVTRASANKELAKSEAARAKAEAEAAKQTADGGEES